MPLPAPTLLAISCSILLPWPKLRPRTSQVCYRKLWDIESLVALWVTEEMGTFSCSHGCRGSKCLCHETRWWNGPTVLTRFHLVWRGPKGFIQARHAWATHKAAPSFLELGHTLPCLPPESEQLVERTPQGVRWALPSPSGILSRLIQCWTAPSVIGGAIAGDLLLSPWHRWLSHCYQSSKRGLYFLISWSSLSLSWLALANARLVSISSFCRVGNSFTWGTINNLQLINKVTRLAKTSSKGTRRQNWSRKIHKFG